MNIKDATKHLDIVLDHLLVLRLELGLGDDDVPEVPHQALDEALGQDEDAQAARVEIRRALDTLMATSETEVQRAALLRLEENFNARVATALDIGFRLGWIAARGSR